MSEILEGQYIAESRTLATGQRGPLPLTSTGALIVDTSAATATPVSSGSWSDTTAPTYKAVVKNAAGSLQLFFGVNEGASKRWLMFFDAASLPSDTAVPKFAPMPVAAGATFSLSFADPRAFATGIVWGVSSTDGTLTHDASAVFSLSAEYF